jgi:hypothetical protein
VVILRLEHDHVGSVAAEPKVTGNRLTLDHST